MGEISVLFGGGRNSKARTVDIQAEECADGENFDLSLADSGFTRRKPFDLIATAPNAGDIRGYAQLIKQDGTITTLIQAAGNVYEWDGASTFTLRGTCNAMSKLRGHWDTHNYTLSEHVIITDLQKLTVVKKWDGTTYANLAHNLGGSFYAKYCMVTNERAYYGNVTSGTATPHMLVGSAVENSETLTVSNKPSSSLAVSDPFYLLTPDLKPINGLVEAFGVVALSSVNGRLWKLSGTTAKDFSLASLFLGSAAKGDEAIANVGNDVVFGREGVIESLSSTDQFGDVETDDLSRWIQPDIDTVTSWRVVYDPRGQKIYCFPGSVSEVHVIHKALLDTDLSPWSKWTTSHSIAFEPTTVWQMKRPSDGVDVVYLGDSSGRIFQLDGTGGQDGGTEDIAAFRLSGLVKSKIDRVTNITGWIDYQKKTSANTLTLTFHHGGENLFDQAIDITIPALAVSAVYGGAYYYGGTNYYGEQFQRRLARKTYGAAGESSQFQVKSAVTGSTDFRFDEIRVRFDEA